MKFTLRELFLLVLIVALALGWVLDRTYLYRQFRTYRNLSTELEQELRARSPASHIEINVSPDRRESRSQYERKN